MKKYNTLFFAALLVLFTNIHSYAQEPAWAWAHVWSGETYEEGNCIAADASGNVYMAGEFFSSRASSIGVADTLINSGTRYDCYIVKYSASGSVIWTKTFGSPLGDEKISGIATDADGNVYVTGESTGTLLSLGSHTLANPGSFVGAFVAKLDASGNVLWARKSDLTSPTGTVLATTLAVDRNNNVIATGVFRCPSISFGTADFTSASPLTTYMYVVKYDASGNFIWARAFGDDGGVEAIATDLVGNICLTGHFIGDTLDFGSFQLTSSASNPSPYFIAQIDPDGNVLWASSGHGVAFGNGITTDPLGNVIVTGCFSDTFVIGGTTLTSAVGVDMFLAKYNSAGAQIWVKRNGGPIAASAIASDSSGCVYITGYYSGATVVFGDSTITLAAGPFDLFAAKYDTAGMAIWSMTAKGGAKDEYGQAIAVDRSGRNIYVSGYTTDDTLRFGAIDVQFPAGSNYRSAFIAKIQLPETSVPAIPGKTIDVKLYPNPANSLLTIVGHNINEIAISDISGKELLRQSAKSDHSTVNIASLVPGIYFVRVVSSDGQAIVRIVKE